MTVQVDENGVLHPFSPRAEDIVLTTPKWVGALFKWKQRDVRLVCMRLDDMVKAHPKQLTDQCSECGHVIGIPPSGMRVIAATKYPRQVKIIWCAGKTGKE